MGWGSPTWAARRARTTSGPRPRCTAGAAAAAAHAQGFQAQVEVGEAVIDRRQALGLHSGSPSSRRHQSSAANSLSNCGGDQRPPQMPGAGRRSSSTAREPSVAGLGDQERGLARRSRAPRLSGRAARPGALRARRCIRAHRAHRARGSRARAHGGAEIHDGLRVGADPSRGVQASACCPQRREHGGRARIAGDPEHAREHALDVAVEDRMALAARRARGWRPRSSGRCRAALHAPRGPAGNSPPCCATSACAQARRFRARA